MRRPLAAVALVIGAWMLMASPPALAQTSTTSTTAPGTTVERTTSTANTGPNDYLYFVAAGGMVALGAGMQMRGRRSAGAHWL
jgi:hypothetical protein